jgi:exopolysaccharide biosynthesis polyprenyl glycosylphosphotransferase
MARFVAIDAPVRRWQLMLTKSAAISSHAASAATNRLARAALAALVSSVDGLMMLAALTLVAWFHGIDAASACFVLVAFLVLAATGTQRQRIAPRVGDQLPTLVERVGTASAITAVPAMLAADPPQALRGLALVTAAVVILVPFGRALSAAMVRGGRSRWGVQQPTLIVGAGRVGAEIANILREHREYGMTPIGFLDSYEGIGLSMPILGDASALAPTVKRNHVTRVVVAFGAMRSAEMVQVLRDCDRLPVDLYVVPRFFELGVAPTASFTDDVWGIPLIRLRRPALRPSSRVVKRAFDLVVATLALVLGAPVLLAAALAVAWTSPGPVLFRQKRVGIDGQPFEVLKFRTLAVNNDSDTTWSVVDDHRLTRVGSLLRHTGLDELPQLINVLRGEMSLVGPRPERPHFARQFDLEVPHYGARERVLSGITGWAQVHGLRGDTPIGDRARFDNQYIEHWSLWRDIVILARTVAQLARFR